MNGHAASHLFSTAPMLDLTDRHYRALMRLISKRALLFSEMIVSEAVVHGGKEKEERFLACGDSEHPLVLQLGGADPETLFQAVLKAKPYGYDGINLNAGCPSERVASAGKFGAYLMGDPDLARTCYGKMQKTAGDVPVSVKTRIALSDQDGDPYERLCRFVEGLKAEGCRTFIIHARLAKLNWSPKKNREKLPLFYETVYRLAGDYPDLEIVLNGNIETLEQAQGHLKHVSGVMVGRAAYHAPYRFIDVDRVLFGDSRAPLSRLDVCLGFLPYVDREIARGVPFRIVTKPLMFLFSGQPKSAVFRRFMTENGRKEDASGKTVLDALKRSEYI